jgi:hypothetical protein
VSLFKRAIVTSLFALFFTLVLSGSASAAPNPLGPECTQEGWQRVDPQTLNFVIRCLPENIVAPTGPEPLPYDPIPLTPFECPEGWQMVDPQTLNFVIKCLPQNLANPPGPGPR